MAPELNRSIPLEDVGDDAMIAYGQNGEAVRHGFSGLDPIVLVAFGAEPA